MGFNCHVCGKRSPDLREATLGAIGKAKVCPSCLRKAQIPNSNIGEHQLEAAPPPDLKVFVIMRQDKGEAVFVNVMSTIYAFYREKDAQKFLDALKVHPNVRLARGEKVEQVYAMGVFEWAVASKRRLVSIAAGVPNLPAPQLPGLPKDDEGGRTPGIVVP